MLHWLRRNPRLLLMSASTLAGNISGILGVLTPGVMLPDAAAELLSRCPSLIPRTPAGIQVSDCQQESLVESDCVCVGGGGVHTSAALLNTNVCTRRSIQVLVELHALRKGLGHM
jgi:hypothetical protein